MTSTSLCVTSCQRPHQGAPYLYSREGSDLGTGGDEDVLSVDNLLAAITHSGCDLVLTRHSAKAVDVGHLCGGDRGVQQLAKEEGWKRGVVSVIK